MQDLTGSGEGTAYIATQGCLANTIPDFWRMVWQEQCRVIVMTTREIERGKNKCARYWPVDKDEKKIEVNKQTQFIIKNENEKNCNDYVLREFSVTRTCEVGCLVSVSVSL